MESNAEQCRAAHGIGWTAVQGNAGHCRAKHRLDCTAPQCKAVHGSGMNRLEFAHTHKRGSKWSN